MIKLHISYWFPVEQWITNKNETKNPVTRIFTIQSTLVISTSVISNNRLSRSGILVPVLT